MCGVHAVDRLKQAGLRPPRECRYPLAVLWLALSLFTGGAAQAAPDSAIDVSATVLSISNCRFRTTSATLAFGVLQTWNPVDVTVTAGLVIRCAGNAAPLATYFIFDDDGLNEGGPNAHRMRNGAALLPYAFSYAPATATIPRNTNTPITVTGTVYGSDYWNATIGTYTDTVTLTIVP